MIHFHQEKTPDEIALPTITTRFIESCRYFFKECRNEKQRRLFAGLLYLIKFTYSEINEFCDNTEKTIRRGLHELLEQNPSNGVKFNIRTSGARRKPMGEEKELLELISNETVGDPMSNLKWIRKSLRILGREIKLSPTAVSKILRKNSYSLRVNSKKLALRGNHPLRDEQFKFIDKLKSEMLDKNLAVLT